MLVTPGQLRENTMTHLSLTDWLVIAAGIAAIAWVNWYFFLADGAAKRSATRSESALRSADRSDLTRTP